MELLIRTGLVSFLSVESFELTFHAILIDSDSSVYERVPNHRVAVVMELLIGVELVFHTAVTVLYSNVSEE